MEIHTTLKVKNKTCAIFKRKETYVKIMQHTFYIQSAYFY